MSFTCGRYYGNKWRHLDFIRRSMTKYGIDLDKVTSAADLCCGTGVVTWLLANLPAMQCMFASDMQLYATVLTQARISNEPSAHVVERLKQYMDKVHARSRDSAYRGGWVTAHCTQRPRQLFTVRNGKAIDAARRVIPAQDTAALAALLEAVLRISNSMGGLSSALPSVPRAGALELREVLPHSRTPGCRVRVVQADMLTMVLKRDYDLIYIDPPYTKNSLYARQYSLLNTVLLQDGPATKGVYHVRTDAVESPFSRPSEAYASFARLFAQCQPRCKWLGVSYSTDGICTISQLRRCLTQAGFCNVRVFRASARKYRGGRVMEVLLLATSA